MSEHKGHMFCSSHQVAQKLGKKHSAVMKDIRNLDCSKKFYKANFEEKQHTINLKNGETQKETMFMMTRDGFMFLIMGYTNPEAIKLKLALIQQYNNMEELIMQ